MSGLEAIASDQCCNAEAALGDLISGSTQNCGDAGCCEYCEGDGECGTSGTHNNCGAFDVYFKTCGQQCQNRVTAPCTTQAPTARPTAAPIVCTSYSRSAIPSSQCCRAESALGGSITGYTKNCKDAGCCEYCEGDGECNTNGILDNCNSWDVYFKHCGMNCPNRNYAPCPSAPVGSPTRYPSRPPTYRAPTGPSCVSGNAKVNVVSPPSVAKPGHLEVRALKAGDLVEGAHGEELQSATCQVEVSSISLCPSQALSSPSHVFLCVCCLGDWLLWQWDCVWELHRRPFLDQPSKSQGSREWCVNAG